MDCDGWKLESGCFADCVRGDLRRRNIRLAQSAERVEYGAFRRRKMELGATCRTERAGNRLAIFSADSRASSVAGEERDEPQRGSLHFRFRTESFRRGEDPREGKRGDGCAVALRGNRERRRDNLYGEFANGKSDGLFYFVREGNRRVCSQIHVPRIPVRRSERPCGEAGVKRCESGRLSHGCAIHRGVENRKRDGQSALEQYFVGTAVEFRRRSDGLPAAR